MGAVPRSILLATALAFLPIPRPAPDDILGVWHGTSTCVKADWNAACNDERVEYRVKPDPAVRGHYIIDAEKLVNGALDPMGDLPMAFDADSAEWFIDLTNPRYSMRWSFRLRGDTLYGLLRLRPDLRVARHVLVTRGPLLP